MIRNMLILKTDVPPVILHNHLKELAIWLFLAKKRSHVCISFLA